MIFAVPSVLFGLALCALPILIHLLYEQRRRVVSWPMMELLARALHERPRSARVYDRLLLALRVALIAALVLALSFPSLMLDRGGWLATRLPGRTVVLLDSSASMGRRVGDSTLLELGKRAVLDELRRGELQVYVAGRGLEEIGDSGLDAPEELKARLRELRVRSGSADIPGALRALDERAGARPIDRLVLVSDMQASSWRGRSAATARAISRLCASVPITLVDLGAELEPSTVNAALVELSRPRGELVDTEAPARFRVTVENTGPARSVELELRLDDVPVRRVELELPADGVAQDAFTLSFASPGAHVIEARLPTDAYPADDRRWLAVEAPVGVPVHCLVEAGVAELEPQDEPTRYLRAFLSPPAEDAPPLFDARLTAWSELPLFDAARPGLLVVSDPTALDAVRIAALEDRVAAGMGLLIFLGPGLDSAEFNARLFKGGRGLAPFAAGETRGLSFAELSNWEAALQLDVSGSAHPAFATDGNPQRWWAALESLRVSRWVELLEEDTDARERGALVSARLDEGSALVVERPFGRGRVMLIATTGDLRWSNLPISPAMAVLDRLARYLLAPQLDARNLEPDAQLTHRVAANGAAQGGIWILPDGESRPAHWDGEARALTLAATGLAGVHELTTAGGELGRFAVNSDPAESRFERVAPESLAEPFPELVWSAGVGAPPARELPPPARELPPPARELPPPARELPLWKPLLALALILLLVEAWYAARGAA